VGHVISAIYEQGVLRPLEPLNLAEYSQVQIQILGTDPAAKNPDLARRIEDTLSAAGLMKPSSVPADLRRISEKRRQELADLYAVGSPLSEVIITERDER